MKLRFRLPRRGGWVPLIPVRYRMPIMFMFGLTPLVAGVDYMLGEESELLSAIETALDPFWWGLFLVISGILTVWGYSFRWPKACILGLYSSGSIFFVLAVGVATKSIGILGGFRSPWFYLIIAVSSWLSAIGYYDQLKGTRLEKKKKEGEEDAS